MKNRFQQELLDSMRDDLMDSKKIKQILDSVSFDKNGLAPAIVKDYYSKKVLMLAYMNRESLEISLKEGRTCFYSRSRKELWRKGETSGAVQKIVTLSLDCDNDAVLVEVVKEGPACHTGTDSCFDNKQVYSDLSLTKGANFDLNMLMDTIRDRKINPSDGSYTTYLFQKGLDKILKKVGEESCEVIIAAKAEDKKETIYEIADLTYHILVLMIQNGISIEDVKTELASRHVIDKKVKQEKMT